MQKTTKVINKQVDFDLLNEVREKRYEFAKKLWNESFLKSFIKEYPIEIINSESSYIKQLDIEHMDFQARTNGLLNEMEQLCSKMQDRSNKYCDQILKLEKELDEYAKIIMNIKSSEENEINSDIKTFKDTETIIQERSCACRDTLGVIDKRISQIKTESRFRKPDVQELYLQLRSLLNNQSKQIKFYSNKAKQ